MPPSPQAELVTIGTYGNLCHYRRAAREMVQSDVQLDPAQEDQLEITLTPEVVNTTSSLELAREYAAAAPK